jgi:hypothetical protein
MLLEYLSTSTSKRLRARRFTRCTRSKILSDAVEDHADIKVWIKDYVRSKDGQAVWQAFAAHYLGSSQLDNVADRAKMKIDSVVYTEERQRCTYETHVSHFKQAHLDLEKA